MHYDNILEIYTYGRERNCTTRAFLFRSISLYGKIAASLETLAFSVHVAAYVQPGELAFSPSHSQARPTSFVSHVVGGLGEPGFLSVAKLQNLPHILRTMLPINGKGCVTRFSCKKMYFNLALLQ